MFSPALTILSIGDNREGPLIRDLVEKSGMLVHLVPLESVSCVRSILTLGDQLADIVLILGAGDQMHELLTQGAVTETIALNGQLVICTGAGSGEIELAELLIAAGSLAYLAPEGNPPSADVALFLHIFLHAVMVKGHDLESAMEHAHGYADAFTLYLS